MTGHAEIVTSLEEQIQALEKGTNMELVDAQIQKKAYIEKSLQTSQEHGSKEQSQKIMMPYRHLITRIDMDNNNIKRYIIIIFVSYKRTTNVKKKRENQQLVWKSTIRSSIQIVDQQKVSIKINLGWIDSQSMQQFYLGICKSYHLVSSSVAVTSTKDLEKTLQAKTRVKGNLFNNYALRTKHF